VSDVVLLDPGDSVFITIDWADVLVDGITLASATHTVPSPLTRVSQSDSPSTGKSQVRVSGALHGVTYMIEAVATLSNGEVVNRQFPVRGWNA